MCFEIESILAHKAVQAKGTRVCAACNSARAGRAGLHSRQAARVADVTLNLLYIHAVSKRGLAVANAAASGGGATSAHWI